VAGTSDPSASGFLRQVGQQHCTYAFAIDGGDDARIKMCADCAEERRMYEDEDREWMCFEVPSVSRLTKEWD
jgi:hypothetical protein